jgi:SAM-dependent methyltransferase
MIENSFDIEAVKAYHERRQIYKTMGYDAYENARNIVALAEPLAGDVLEIGTGRGLLSCYLAKKHFITSLDIDGEVQIFAKELAKSENVLDRIRFQVRDIVTEPYPDRSFDIVISAHALHHFEQPEKVVQIMASIARKKIIIADFNYEGFNIISRMHQRERSVHNEGKASIEEVGNWLRRDGFRINRYESQVTITFIGER